MIEYEQRIERLMADLAQAQAALAAQAAGHQRTDEALRRSEERLRSIIRGAPVAIWTLDRDGIFTFSEGSGLKSLGFKASELVGRSVFELYAGCEPIHEQTRRALAGEEFSASNCVRGVSFESRYSPLRDAQGQIAGLVGVAIDVTERNRAIAALSESEARYRHIVANVPGMVYQFVIRRDGSTALPFVSDACREIYGLEPEQLHADGSRAMKMVHPEDRAGFDLSVAASFANLSRWRWEGRLVLESGEEKWIQGTSQPERQANGDVLWDGVVLDVTPRKRAEEALRCAHMDLERRVRERTAELARTNESLEAEVAERRRAEELARRHADALAQAELLARGQAKALTGTLDRLASEPSLDKFLGHVLRTINEQFQADGSTVWFHDPGAGLQSLHMGASDGFAKDETALAAAERLPAAPAVDVRLLLDTMALTRQPIVVDADSAGQADDAANPWRPFFSRGVRTLLIAPLLMGDDLIGSLAIESRRDDRWRAEEIELAGALARQACLAVQLTRMGVERHEQAVLAERARMASEIHDTLAQGFAGIIVQLQAAGQALGAERQDAPAAEALTHVAQALDLARENLREARRSVWALSPGPLQGRELAAAFRELVHRLPADAAPRVQFVCRGQPRALNAEVETNLLRIGQEALANALGHSRADRIVATLDFHARRVELCVQDNGAASSPAMPRAPRAAASA